MLLNTLFQLTTPHTHKADNGGCYNYSPCDLCVYGLGKVDDYINKTIKDGVVDFRRLWDKAMGKLDGKYFGAPWVYRDTSVARLIQKYLLTPDSRYASNDKKKDAIIKEFVWAAMTKDPRLDDESGSDDSSTVWNFFSQFKCSASTENNRMTKLLTSNLGVNVVDNRRNFKIDREEYTWYPPGNGDRILLTPYQYKLQNQLCVKYVDGEEDIKEENEDGTCDVERVHMDCVGAYEYDRWHRDYYDKYGEEICKWKKAPTSDQPTISTAMHTMAKSSNILTEGQLITDQQIEQDETNPLFSNSYPALNNNQQQQPAINTWIWDGMQALRDIFCQNKSFHTIGGVEDLDWLDENRVSIDSYDSSDYDTKDAQDTIVKMFRYATGMTRGSIGLNQAEYLDGQTIDDVKWKGLKATWNENKYDKGNGGYDSPDAPDNIGKDEWSDEYGYATQHHPGVYAYSGNQTIYDSIHVYDNGANDQYWWIKDESHRFNITRVVRELTDADKVNLSQSTIQYLQHTPSLRQLVSAVVEYFMTYGWYEARTARLDKWEMSEDEYRAWLYTSRCADFNVCYAPEPLPTISPSTTPTDKQLYKDTDVTNRAGIWNKELQCMMKGVESWAVNEAISVLLGKKSTSTSTPTLSTSIATSLINRLMGINNINNNKNNICNGNGNGNGNGNANETDCNITLTTNNNNANNTNNDRVTTLTIIAVTCGLACIACVAVMVGMVHGINKKKKETLSSMLSIDSMFGGDHNHTTPRPYVDSNINLNTNNP